MNDFMSLGIHRCWKETFVSDIGVLSNEAVVLDVAGGTGDISFKILEKQKEKRGIIGNGGVKVICFDINDHMLEGGRCRAKEKGLKEDGLIIFFIYFFRCS
jgi:ubiquinone/menaquinone biosynthesis C-methylase UbiE